jgi:CMP/dCMP kinase
MQNNIPIIAIDGTSSSGKGTIAYLLSKHFNFNYLNSGALYRISAHLATLQGLSLSDKNENNLDKIVTLLRDACPDIIFEEKKVLYKGEDVWPIIGTQHGGNNAALISFYPPLRYAVRDFQRNKIQSPGLVAEGRDMGSEVFPDASVKIYLDASPEVRARRRLIDEEKSGSGKTFDMILGELQARDNIDKNHSVGALKICPDAFYIDTSDKTREEVFELVRDYCIEKLSLTFAKN